MMNLSALLVLCMIMIEGANCFTAPYNRLAVNHKSTLSRNLVSKELPKNFFHTKPSRDSALQVSTNEGKGDEKMVEFDISAWLNINTRGGVLVWCAILIVIPVAAYAYFVSTGLEETTVGAYVGALFVLLTMVAWASTYIFRVATKDMTYAKQLRDYENAVLQKRLEELADDEIDALMREIELEEDDDANAPPMKGMNNDSR